MGVGGGVNWGGGWCCDLATHKYCSFSLCQIALAQGKINFWFRKFDWHSGNFVGRRDDKSIGFEILLVLKLRKK